VKRGLKQVRVEVIDEGSRDDGDDKEEGKQGEGKTQKSGAEAARQ
jgi:hypothetical protein